MLVDGRNEVFCDVRLGEGMASCQKGALLLKCRKFKFILNNWLWFSPSCFLIALCLVAEALHKVLPHQ